ncbi:CARDB protein [Natronorubrum daqingense]|uniref:CARDB protein n=2 Tax=Natronorubrum daqingense TaxID=588898 RepID=A0A1N7AMJ5_9EURY|nr:CARDB domain-containing protein [Natronorubrum daqingense]APX97932.1 hypothetical protein BB347_15665 [Natronorubrum daqingense]SIR40370.1 CARDB protein [Natronorubrum daqingense]
MVSPKAIWTVVAACVVLTLAVPTVAITMDEDTASDDVILEPTTSYASVTDEGELEVDLERLNERAVTTFDDVFTISVGDDAVSRVWIEDVEGLTFYENGNQHAELSESSPLEPEAGESARIGVSIDTHVDHAATETFTVHVEYEDDDGKSTGVVTLEDLEVEPETVETGENVTVNATYENVGERTKTTDAELTVDGTVVDSESVTVSPGDTETVHFERQLEWPGETELGVDGVEHETVLVDGPPVDVLEASVVDTELAAGETGEIEATVSNPTDKPVERTLELAVDGIVVDTQTVALESASEQTVTFEHEFDGEGTTPVAVSGVDAGTVTVDEPTFEIQNRELSATTMAALAPPMAASLLVIATVANRRWVKK